jgi:hypothetical protein
MPRHHSHRAQLLNRLHVSLAGLPGTLLSLAFIAGIGNRTALARGKPLDWKPTEQGMLRVDDHPVSEWNLYEADKKDSRLLLEMNGRFLLVDVAARVIFEIDPAKIEHKGANLHWDPDDRPDKPLETINWIVKDVGSSYRFSARLVAENHVIDVQIPHPLDLKPIPRRYY